MSHKNHKKLHKPNQRLVICKSSPVSFIPGELAGRERSLDFYLPSGLPLPNPDPVLKRMGKDISVYTDLLSDDHVGGCADSRAAGVESLNWAVDAGKAPTRATTFCQDMLDGLKLHRVISEALSTPLFGYGVLEITWQLGADNLVRAVKVQRKPCRWFCFDGANRLMFRSKSNPLGEVLPERKFLLGTHKASYENPYGIPVLSRAFWPAMFKKNGFKFWAVFCEKYGMPHIVGKVPRGAGPNEIGELMHDLENMVQDAVAVIPDDSSVEIKDAAASGGSVDAYERYLGYCEKSISKALLGQTLTTDVGDKGSYAAAKTHMEVRADIITGDKKIVEEIIQQLLDWTCEFNFPGEAVPVFTMFAPEDVDMQQAERDEALTRTGVRFRKSYFQREYGLTEDDFDLVDPLAAAAATGGTTTFAAKAPAPAGAAPEQLAEDMQLSPEALQTQAAALAQPVMDAIKAGGGLEEIEAAVMAAYPDMDTAKFQEQLARALYVAEIWGRMNAGRN